MEQSYPPNQTNPLNFNNKTPVSKFQNQYSVKNKMIDELVNTNKISKEKCNVRVHIMDPNDSSKVREIVHCQKSVITGGMLYFKKHVENIQISQFESIDIHVQCDPIIFKILYKWSEAEIIQNKEPRERELERIAKTFDHFNII